MVIRAGEDLLADIDSKAILLLRENQLIWSSFSEDNPLSDLDLTEGHQPHRALALGDAKDLRLFFISVLWRAAASSRPEFKEIQLDNYLVQSLRAKLLAKDPGPLTEFPVQLFQIVTKGPRHNRSPILENKPVIGLGGEIKGHATFVRFYFDGLVAHIHTSFDCDPPPEYLATCLGNLPHTFVFAHTFEQSRTYRNIRQLAANQGAR